MTTPLRAAVRATVSAAEANRQFSKLLRGVREGRSYVVTSHGRPIARIAPVGQPMGGAARTALFRRLEVQRVVKAGRWVRDELYERSSGRRARRHGSR